MHTQQLLFLQGNAGCIQHWSRWAPTCTSLGGRRSIVHIVILTILPTKIAKFLQDANQAAEDYCGSETKDVSPADMEKV